VLRMAADDPDSDMSLTEGRRYVDVDQPSQPMRMNYSSCLKWSSPRAL
jgi:hypothetical protein